MREVPSWDQYFYGFAKHAATRSKDLSTHIGAVIVDEYHGLVSSGYNSFPAGLRDNLPERQERPEKYFWFEHAERNAILTAARRGVRLDKCTMYLNCFVPCTDCARSIIQAGIREVVLGTSHQSTKKKWLEAADRSLVMFDEASVTLRYPDGPPINIRKMRREIQDLLDSGDFED